MKGPRYWVGFAIAMLAWALAEANGKFLSLGAWLMDYEKELSEVRAEVDEIHRMQERIRNERGKED